VVFYEDNLLSKKAADISESPMGSKSFRGQPIAFAEKFGPLKVLFAMG